MPIQLFASGIRGFGDDWCEPSDKFGRTSQNPPASLSVADSVQSEEALA
jgi:hypothetical protein